MQESQGFCQALHLVHAARLLLLRPSRLHPSRSRRDLGRSSEIRQKAERLKSLHTSLGKQYHFHLQELDLVEVQPERASIRRSKVAVENDRVNEFDVYVFGFWSDSLDCL